MKNAEKSQGQPSTPWRSLHKLTFSGTTKYNTFDLMDLLGRIVTSPLVGEVGRRPGEG